jgi:hypothetical protein
MTWTERGNRLYTHSTVKVLAANLQENGLNVELQRERDEHRLQIRTPNATFSFVGNPRLYIEDGVDLLVGRADYPVLRFSLHELTPIRKT